MVNLQNGGGRDSTAPFRYPEGSYLKFGHFCAQFPKARYDLFCKERNLGLL